MKDSRPTKSSEVCEYAGMKREPKQVQIYVYDCQSNILADSTLVDRK